MDLSAKHEAKYQYWRENAIDAKQLYKKAALKFGIRYKIVRKKLTKWNKLSLIFQILDKNNSKREDIILNYVKAEEIVNYKNKH